MAANKTIGGINVTISATTEKFNKGITQARGLLDSFKKSLGLAEISLTGFQKALVSGLVGGAGVRFLRDAMNRLDAMGELSDKLGVATENLAGYQIAAEEAGIASSVLERSMVTLSAKMGIAGDVALRKWIEDTSQLRTQSEKLAAAVDMFGKRGADMVRFLNGGTAALDEAALAAKRMGLAVSRDQIRAIEAANDSIGRARMTWQGFWNDIAIATAGPLKATTDGISALAASFRAVGDNIAYASRWMNQAWKNDLQRLGLKPHSVEDARQIMLQKLNGPTPTVTASSKPTGRAAQLLGTVLGAITSPTRRQLSIMGTSANNQFVTARNRALMTWAMLPMLNADNAFNAQMQRQKTAKGIMGLMRGGVGGVSDLLQRGLGAAASALGSVNLQQRMATRPALAFAESGSVESYRQQAAIRRQSENIQKKQLSTQERMLAKLDSIDRKTATVLEAGLA